MYYIFILLIISKPNYPLNRNLTQYNYISEYLIKDPWF